MPEIVVVGVEQDLDNLPLVGAGGVDLRVLGEARPVVEEQALVLREEGLHGGGEVFGQCEGAALPGVGAHALRRLLPVSAGEGGHQVVELGAQPRGEGLGVAAQLARGEHPVGDAGVGDAFLDELRVAQRLPLLDEAGVDPLEERPEVRDHVVHVVVLDLVGHILVEGLVDLRQVAQEHPFRALQAVAPHEVGEAEVLLDHFARHRFGRDRVAADPRVVAAEAVEGGVDVVGQGLRVGELVEAVDPLLVGHPLFLEPRQQLGLRAVELAAQDHHRVLEHRLHEAQDVERVLGRQRVEALDRLHQEQRQVVEEGEIDLQLLVHRHPEI